MKLIAKVCPAPGVPSGSAILLCDESGEPLPNQVAIETKTTVTDLTEITVTFIVDGERVALR